MPHGKIAAEFSAVAKRTPGYVCDVAAPWAPMPYFLKTIKVPSKHYTGFSEKRIKIPLQHSTPTQSTRGQPRPPFTSSYRRSHSRHTSVDPEREDAIARVQNLAGFDPVIIVKRERARKRQAWALQKAIMDAATKARVSAESAMKSYQMAWDSIRHMIIAAKRSNAAAVKVARKASAACPQMIIEAEAAIEAELRRQAILRAKEAAFSASKIAFEAVHAMVPIEPQLEPVLEFVAKERRRVMMKEIQQRVLLLMDFENSGINCNLLIVDLIHFEIKLLEQIQFVAGKAEIKPESANIMAQLSCAKQCITQTCSEFDVPNMHWKVQGHTAKSKKSKDGGMATSNGRAQAVCADLGRKGVDTSTLHPEGCGCYKPPADKKADPRRVEIHVLSKEEAIRVCARRQSYADITGLVGIGQ